MLPNSSVFSLNEANKEKGFLGVSCETVKLRGRCGFSPVDSLNNLPIIKGCRSGVDSIALTYEPSEIVVKAKSGKVAPCS